MMKRSRRMFSPQDDEELAGLVRAVGDGNWVHVSQRMPPGFTPRQCRERWRNYLDPRLGREPWTEAEDARLVEEFLRLGTRWTMIAEQFPGRSGNTVRNRYFLLVRKSEKKTRVSRPPPPLARLLPRPPAPVQRASAPPAPEPRHPRTEPQPPRTEPQQPPTEPQQPRTEPQKTREPFSLFNPENFTDLSQENVMSLFFPTR
jgi:hypothetical protein